MFPIKYFSKSKVVYKNQKMYVIYLLFIKILYCLSFSMFSLSIIMHRILIEQTIDYILSKKFPYVIFIYDLTY